MNRGKVMLATAALLALGLGCETKMAPLDLSAAGVNVTVSAPEGATVEKGRATGARSSTGILSSSRSARRRLI